MTDLTLERCVVCESRNAVGAERCDCCEYRFAPRAEPFEVDEGLAPTVRVVGPDGEPAAYPERGHDLGRVAVHRCETNLISNEPMPGVNP